MVHLKYQQQVTVTSQALFNVQKQTNSVKLLQLPMEQFEILAGLVRLTALKSLALLDIPWFARGC